jgi:plastocyanin
MKIFTWIILLIFASVCIGGASAAITYKSSVDLDYGFFQVIGIGTKPANDTMPESAYFTDVNYTNNNLTINVGDTVVWTNYDPKNWPVTIMSQQGMWNEKDSYLKYSLRKFNYTFTEPGIYGVYIKERDKLHQTIVVNPIDVPITPAIGTVNVTEQTATPFKTPVLASTQIPIIPEKTSARAVPGFTAAGVIGAVAIVGVLLFLRTAKRI